MNNFQFDPNKKFNPIPKQEEKMILDLEKRRVKQVINVLPAISSINDNIPNLTFSKPPEQILPIINIVAEQNLPDLISPKIPEQTIPNLTLLKTLNKEENSPKAPEQQTVNKEEKAKSVLQRLKETAKKTKEWYDKKLEQLNQYLKDTKTEESQVGSTDLGAVKPVPQRRGTPNEIPQKNLGPVERVPKLKETKTGKKSNPKERIIRAWSEKLRHRTGEEEITDLNKSGAVLKRFKRVFDELLRITTFGEEQKYPEPKEERQKGDKEQWIKTREKLLVEDKLPETPPQTTQAEAKNKGTGNDQESTVTTGVPISVSTTVTESTTPIGTAEVKPVETQKTAKRGKGIKREIGVRASTPIVETQLTNESNILTVTAKEESQEQAQKTQPPAPDEKRQPINRGPKIKGETTTEKPRKTQSPQPSAEWPEETPPPTPKVKEVKNAQTTVEPQITKTVKMTGNLPPEGIIDITPDSSEVI